MENCTFVYHIAQAIKQAAASTAPLVTREAVTGCLSQAACHRLPVTGCLPQAACRRTEPMESVSRLKYRLTQAMTQIVTQAMTQIVTQAMTQIVTQAMTQIVTQAMTQTVTQAMTQTVTQVMSNTDCNTDMTRVITLSALEDGVAVKHPIMPLA